MRVARAFALALAPLLAAGAAMAEEAACAFDRLDIRGAFGTARFTVEIADEPVEQAQGLMFRDSLASSQGMLFVYPRAGSPSFWMKNTLIPLDMLFITPEGVVQSVHAMAEPGDLTPVNGGSGVLAVLEIRGGLAAMMGIGPGAELRHPAFGSNAAWACDE